MKKLFVSAAVIAAAAFAAELVGWGFTPPPDGVPMGEPVVIRDADGFRDALRRVASGAQITVETRAEEDSDSTIDQTRFGSTRTYPLCPMAFDQVAKDVQNQLRKIEDKLRQVKITGDSTLREIREEAKLIERVALYHAKADALRDGIVFMLEPRSSLPEVEGWSYLTDYIAAPIFLDSDGNPIPMTREMFSSTSVTRLEAGGGRYSRNFGVVFPIQHTAHGWGDARAYTEAVDAEIFNEGVDRFNALPFDERRAHYEESQRCKLWSPSQGDDGLTDAERRQRRLPYEIDPNSYIAQRYVPPN
ncbi:MAG: hypothetical protein AAF196_02890 [Planctomycetota bacterium]